MKIPGWWRVRHLYYRTKALFIDYQIRIKTAYDKWHYLLILKLYTLKFLPNGINAIGFAKGDIGLAEHLRLVVNAIRANRISFCVIDMGKPFSFSQNNTEMLPYIKNSTKYSINLFCYNADFTIDYMKGGLKGEIAKRHYNIGYGYWELSNFPEAWFEQDDYLDEIWAPSLFIKSVIEKKTRIPVHYMPIPIDFNIPQNISRSQFGLKENYFQFLFSFDMNSFIERKNPWAVLKAFQETFPIEQKQTASLVIKVNRVKNHAPHDTLIQKIENTIKGDPRITLIDEVLDRATTLGLISTCDSYISLHRAEGFGLGMAEAMKMGKVVIGTSYSGNTDFMNEENSCLVNYKLVEVKPEEYLHVEPDTFWAEPDITHAKYYMKKVFEDRQYTERISANAKRHIDAHWNFKTIGENIKKRYDEILSKPI